MIRNIIRTVFLILLSTALHAQELEWQKSYGGTGADIINSIEPTSDGGFIMGGSSNSGVSGNKTEASQGGYDYWIVKTDSLGNIQWQNTIGGSLDDNLYSVLPTADGGYICGGTSLSLISGDKTDDPYGNSAYWVVKLDALGNIVWQRTIGGTSTNYLRSISITPDGGFICGGISDSGVAGDKTGGNFGFYDYWILKLDSTGLIQWQRTLGGNGLESLNDVYVTDDGGSICIGVSYSSISGTKTENSQGKGIIGLSN